MEIKQFYFELVFLGIKTSCRPARNNYFSTHFNNAIYFRLIMLTEKIKDLLANRLRKQLSGRILAFMSNPYHQEKLFHNLWLWIALDLSTEMFI